jgi:hypothetical protein
VQASPANWRSGSVSPNSSRVLKPAALTIVSSSASKSSWAGNRWSVRSLGLASALLLPPSMHGDPSSDFFTVYADGRNLQARSENHVRFEIIEPAKPLLGTRSRSPSAGRSWTRESDSLSARPTASDVH